MKEGAVVSIIVLMSIALLALVIEVPALPWQPTLCPKACNVILVVVDTVAAGHLKDYGYDRDTMPLTEAFFSSGTRFQNAYSAAPWTFASFPSFYFSKLPSLITFKDLAQHGDPSFISAIRSKGDTIYGVMLPKTVFIVEAVDSPFRSGEIEYEDSETFTQGADAAVRMEGEYQRTGTPFFLMLHTFDAHDPYAPAPADAAKFDTPLKYTHVTMSDLLQANVKSDPAMVHDFRLLYDQQLSGVDRKLGGFLDSLPPELLQNTVVIVIADHGEAFMQHGHFWHGISLYDEELHVPFFMRIPGAAPRVVQEPISLLDLGPTILSIMHVSIPLSFTGQNILPLAAGRSLGPRLLRFENGYPSFLHLSKGTVPQAPKTIEETGSWDTNLPIIEQWSKGARMGELVYTHSSIHKTWRLFDLSVDPQEKTNLLLDPAAATSAHQGAIDSFIVQLKALHLWSDQ